MFYKKSKQKNEINFLEHLSGETRLKMSWELVQKGMSPNEAFKLTTLDDFLKPKIDIQAANDSKPKLKRKRDGFQSNLPVCNLV